MRFTISDTCAAGMTTAHERINRLLAGTLAVVVMLLLKRHYSQAGPEQLAWMLAPTAHLIAWITGTAPLWEAGVGYVDFGRGIIIAPACAGVNFMIMAFGLAVFCSLGRLRRLLALTVWMALALSGAYLATLGVNTLRIILSMALYRADIDAAWLTPEALHRVTGVWLYLGALGLSFKGLQPIMTWFGERFDPQGRSRGAVWPPWLPLAWYLCGAVGVPAIHLVVQRPLPAFGEHCLAVVTAAVL
ncbi:MAG: exosortase K, partial [Desulfosarcinaceae bacterium]